MKKKKIIASAVLIIVVVGLLAIPGIAVNQKMCWNIRILSWQLSRADQDFQRRDITEQMNNIQILLVLRGYLEEKQFELKNILPDTPEATLFKKKLGKFLRSDCSSIVGVMVSTEMYDNPRKEVLCITVRDRPKKINNWNTFIEKVDKPKE